MSYVNTSDLYDHKREVEKMIKDSEKRIIDHIDRRFNTIEEGVDYIQYGGTTSKYVKKYSNGEDE